MKPTQLFHVDARSHLMVHKRIYAMSELLHTLVDVAAALCFLTGSILSLSDETKAIATWFYIVGSVFFLLKPIIRISREVRYAALGDVDALARRAGWSRVRDMD
jgi:hypothetical protein